MQNVLWQAMLTIMLSTRVAADVRRTPSDIGALGALVGEWQSDTTAGVSARTFCAWTPRRSSMLCELRIDAPAGQSTALSLFSSDSASGQFVLHVLSRPADTMQPVTLVIRGNLWYYGGQTASSDGRFYRTVNDFSRADVYYWRQESSVDGQQWTEGIHGQSRRI